MAGCSWVEHQRMVPVVVPAGCEYASLWGWNAVGWWLRAGVGTLLGPGTAGALHLRVWGVLFLLPCEASSDRVVWSGVRAVV